MPSHTTGVLALPSTVLQERTSSSMGVCADALYYLPSDKARQDEQHLGDQVVECRRDRDLLIEAGGIALLQDITTEAAITIVDEVECRVARHHLADGAV
jgi:hypothetical protein